jgi:hypothetical protein
MENMCHSNIGKSNLRQRINRLWVLTRLTGITLVACAAGYATHGAQTPTTSLTLAWDATVSPDITNYNVYYGFAPGTYNGSIAAADHVSTTISNLVVGTRYYFAVTSVNQSGMESDYSTEISYTPTAQLGRITLHLALDSSLRVTLSGTGAVGSAYNVQWSANAVSWSNLTSLTIPASGNFSLVDPASATNKMRLYRLTMP